MATAFTRHKLAMAVGSAKYNTGNAMATPRIFISMGTPYTETQMQFRNALESFLRDECDANPRIIGKNEYPDGSPLKKIKEVMSTCHGVLIVAYERKFVQDGAEKRGSDGEKVFNNRTYTTPWNHIESALAFALNIPIYIICEKNLTEEGLIENKIDWFVQYVTIHPNEFDKQQVRESLRSWITQRVAPNAGKSRFVKAFTGELKFSEMRPKEIWSLIGIITASFSAGVAATLLIPKLFT